MRIIGVIPARYASSRFEGKVLAHIQNKPMIQHVWERAKKCKTLQDVIIACDDERVLKAAKNFGAKAVMTSPKHQSGTDRIAEAIKYLKADIIVNIQGDEPLIKPKVIDALVTLLKKEKQCSMATVIKRIEKQSELNDSNVVKVVIDKNGYALYFSRSVVPFNRDNSKIEYFKHLGIYAYKRDFLLKFTKLPKSKLEIAEKLEQLRVLESGYKIKTIITDIETIGVDTPEDLERVKKTLK